MFQPAMLVYQSLFKKRPYEAVTSWHTTPVIWGSFHKPWNKDPVMNQSGFISNVVYLHNERKYISTGWPDVFFANKRLMGVNRGPQWWFITLEIFQSGFDSRQEGSWSGEDLPWLTPWMDTIWTVYLISMKQLPCPGMLRTLTKPLGVAPKFYIH